MSGYKCELETGRTLKAQIDKRGWTVSIEGLNGDDWKPSIRSKAPIWEADKKLSLIHISEPTRLLSISYAVFCLKKKKTHLTT